MDEIQKYTHFHLYYSGGGINKNVPPTGKKTLQRRKMFRKIVEEKQAKSVVPLKTFQTYILLHSNAIHMP